jgi:hypothetical protein
MGDQNSRATGHTQVETYQPTGFDETPDGPSLVEVHLTETFSGDIQGEGSVRVIQAAGQDGSASFVGLERVRGSIAGRKGTFLLQIAGTIVAKEVKARWFVIPDSGTVELKGLHGEGGFEGHLGQHGSIWLDYHFE